MKITPSILAAINSISLTSEAAGEILAFVQNSPTQYHYEKTFICRIAHWNDRGNCGSRVGCGYRIQEVP